MLRWSIIFNSIIIDAIICNPKIIKSMQCRCTDYIVHLYTYIECTIL